MVNISPLRSSRNSWDGSVSLLSSRTYMTKAAFSGSKIFPKLRLSHLTIFASSWFTCDVFCGANRASSSSFQRFAELGIAGWVVEF